MTCDSSQNKIVTNGNAYEGRYYAYEATGGFEFERGVGAAVITPSGEVIKYDMTNSLQVHFPLSVLADKLGDYDASCAQFEVDEITINALDFKTAVDLSSEIISVGLYENLYTNFNSLLNNYFNMPHGVTSLFTVDSSYNSDNLGNANPANNNAFNKQSVIDLMNYSAKDASGRYVDGISGSIKISRINAMLIHAVDKNPFNNRPSGATVADGFKEHDLIYVPTGTTVTLVADILNKYTGMPSNFAPRTEVELAQIVANSTGPDFENGDYSQKTTFTNSSITRVVHVPLLISVKDDSP